MSTKFHLVKAMIFPVVTYGCESWTVKKAEHRRIDAFEMWCWIRLLRVPWHKGPNQDPVSLFLLLSCCHSSFPQSGLLNDPSVSTGTMRMLVGREEIYSGLFSSSCGSFLLLLSPSKKHVFCSWVGFRQPLHLRLCLPSPPGRNLGDYGAFSLARC